VTKFLCPTCGISVGRSAVAIAGHYAKAHAVQLTQPEAHRLAVPERKESKVRPGVPEERVTRPHGEVQGGAPGLKRR
jgi:hypothetical protein